MAQGILFQNPSYFGLAALVSFLLFLLAGGMEPLRCLVLLFLLLALVAEFHWKPHAGWQRKVAVAGYFLCFLSVAMLMIPASHVSLEKARRINCRSNLRELLRTVNEYADANGGWYPQRLSDCREYEKIGRMRCPSRKGTPGGLEDSYRYCGRGRRRGGPGFPLFVENTGNHEAGFSQMIYSDGTFAHGAPEKPAKK